MVAKINPGKTDFTLFDVYLMPTRNGLFWYCHDMSQKGSSKELRDRGANGIEWIQMESDRVK